jgi:hypothetical protein
MNKTTVVLWVFLAALAMFLSAFYLMPKVPLSRETFAQKEIGMPVEGVGMGPYDNVSVPGASGWLMSEAPKGASAIGDTAAPSFLSNPRTSQSCCPSGFTTDSGCVCLTSQDLGVMASRGGNK